MQDTIFSTVESALKKVKDLVSSDGTLLRNKCLEWSEKMNPSLIGALLKNKMCLKTFFTEVDGIFVFDKTRFIQFLHSKQFLPDSYTSYKNTIGLVNENNEFISKTNDVVLTFPYKDCVLAGGQTKDEEKRSEVFYNEILAPEAITTLFSPKAFCKVKRIGTTQHNTTQHNTTQHNTTQHNTTQHNTTQHNTTQHNTTQHNT